MDTVCFGGVVLMCVFTMRENMAERFHPCLCIIEKSLNSHANFFQRFPGEDWFSP